METCVGPNKKQKYLEKRIKYISLYPKYLPLRHFP